jgi:hypothetical protein
VSLERFELRSTWDISQPTNSIPYNSLFLYNRIDIICIMKLLILFLPMRAHLLDRKVNYGVKDIKKRYHDF